MTSERLTPEALAAIKARHSAIRPVIWEARYAAPNASDKEKRWLIGYQFPTTLDYGGVFSTMFRGATDEYQYARENADFVAHAPSDIAALLAHAAALEAENAALRKVAEAAQTFFSVAEESGGPNWIENIAADIHVHPIYALWDALDAAQEAADGDE